jgi:hypothetical protein
MSYEVENIYKLYQNAIVGDGAPSGTLQKHMRDKVQLRLINF